MKQLIVLSGCFLFIIGCATTAPQDSSQSTPTAATPSQPSQPTKTMAKPVTPAVPETETPAAPKMIEVVVETAPPVDARGRRVSQHTISITPAPDTTSLHEQTFILTQSADETSREPRARQYEEIVIVPHSVSSDTLYTPRDVDIATFADKNDITERGGETFFILPTH